MSVKELGCDKSSTACNFLLWQFCMPRVKYVLLAVECGGALICSDACVLALS